MSGGISQSIIFRSQSKHFPAQRDFPGTRIEHHRIEARIVAFEKWRNWLIDGQGLLVGKHGVTQVDMEQIDWLRLSTCCCPGWLVVSLKGSV